MKNIRLFITIIFTTFSLSTNAMVTKKPCGLQKDFLKDLATAILENPNEKETLYTMLPQKTKEELLKAEKTFYINETINKAIAINLKKQKILLNMHLN